MFLELTHTKLDLFKISKDLVLQCYAHTRSLPSEEKYGLAQQIRRASVSVHLNIAEGCSRKSPRERTRFYEIARGSLIEIDTAFDIAIALTYLNPDALHTLGALIKSCFKILSKLIKDAHLTAHH